MSMSVTQIISQIYPVQDTILQTWYDNFNKELIAAGKSPVSYDGLMKITQVVWDMLHTYFLNCAMGIPNITLPEKLKAFEQPIKDVVKLYEVEWLLHEFTIRKNDEYEGHPDLLAMMTWEGKRIKALVDAKSYGVYRYYFWLPLLKEWSTEKKLNGNTKKVALQTSLYRDALMFSPEDHVKRHWNVSHSFCFHLLPDKVDVVPLKYDVQPYLEWLKNNS